MNKRVLFLLIGFSVSSLIVIVFASFPIIVNVSILDWGGSDLLSRLSLLVWGGIQFFILGEVLLLLFFGPILVFEVIRTLIRTF